MLFLPFEEGLAEAHGDDWDRFPIEGNIRHLLEDAERYGYIPGPGYGLAGHFVSYLKASRGADQIMPLDTETQYLDSFTSAEAAFSRVYGESLDEVITKYQNDYPHCETHAFRDKTFDCNRNVMSAPTELDIFTERGPGRVDRPRDESRDQPPTDPDVRDSRIRLFTVQIRNAQRDASTIRGRGSGYLASIAMNRFQESFPR